jgi:hypothetical protein
MLSLIIDILPEITPYGLSWDFNFSRLSINMPKPPGAAGVPSNKALSCALIIPHVSIVAILLSVIEPVLTHSLNSALNTHLTPP